MKMKPIYLTEIKTSNIILNEIAILAGISNCKSDKLSILDLASIFKANQLKYPASSENMELVLCAGCLIIYQKGTSQTSEWILKITDISPLLNDEPSPTLHRHIK